MRLKLGAAREIITPELGGLFAGYDSPLPSTGVYDDLTATVFALEFEETRVLMVCLTLAMTDKEQTSQLQDICAKAANVPSDNVIISCTHTHSGPLYFQGDDPPQYIEKILKPKLLKASSAAAENMQAVTVGIATTQTMVGINRRELLKDDEVILGQNPWGAYDPEMTVISFKCEKGNIIGDIIHCTAHNTACGIITEVSRDWAGVMTDRLEAESGGMTVFFNGCAGDISPRTPNGGSTADLKQAMEIGALAGIDAVRAYYDIRDYRSLDLSVVVDEVRIPYAPIMPLESAEELYNELKDSLVSTFDPEAYELMMQEHNRRGYASARFHPGMCKLLLEIIDLHKKGETGPADFVHPQTLVRMGPVVFVPIPFEPSVEISLRLRAYSKFGHTLAMGFCNGYNSYLVTQDQLCRGGYEVERFRWHSARQLPDNTDTLLINENLRIMEKL